MCVFFQITVSSLGAVLHFEWYPSRLILFFWNHWRWSSFLASCADDYVQKEAFLRCLRLHAFSLDAIESLNVCVFRSAIEIFMPLRCSIRKGFTRTFIWPNKHEFFIVDSYRGLGAFSCWREKLQRCLMILLNIRYVRFLCERFHVCVAVEKSLNSCWFSRRLGLSFCDWVSDVSYRSIVKGE